MKLSPEEIRKRFDAEVERFSNLETGQSATMDAPIVLDLVSRAAAATTPQARRLLDIGCGAGNYTLKLLERLPDLDVDLVDLSEAMLARARQRVGAATSGTVTTHQADIRNLPLPSGRYDLMVAAAVLHHLRRNEEWEEVYTKLFDALSPGGSLWIADLVDHALPGVQQVMKERYGEYLVGLGGIEYRDRVFGYIEAEDSPQSLGYQLELMRRVGFETVDVLHKNGPFAAFVGRKAGSPQ